MSYTLSALTTKADCTALINMVTKEKVSLQHRRTGLMIQTDNVTLTAQEIQIGMAAIQSEIDLLTGVLATLPPGPLYEDNHNKKVRAEYKLFLLNQRKGNYGPIALVQKEYDAACFDGAVIEADALIAALTVRRDELPS